MSQHYVSVGGIMLQMNDTAYLTLLYLAERPEQSGYELRAAMLKQITHIYPVPTKSHLYTELRRLEGHGLTTCREVSQTMRPNKRAYTCTPAGREALQIWTLSMAPPDLFRSLALVRLYKGVPTDLGAMTHQISERQRATRQAMDALPAHIRADKGPTKDAPLTSEEHLRLLTYRRAELCYQSELLWLEEALACLQAMQAPAVITKVQRAKLPQPTAAR